MKRVFLLSLALLLLVLALASCEREPMPEEDPVASERETEMPQTEEDGGSGVFTITDEDLYDRILGGWIGSMIGVAWGASTEFRWQGEIIPAADMPKWRSAMINDAFGQDDLYVEIPFMDAMAEHGVFCDVDVLAESFRDSAFPLWHANMQGRKNLREGLLPPESGSGAVNPHADDIDWQIECDFLGMMYPGMVNAAAARSFDVGHIMNGGDGVYGGVFIAAMHAAAYSASSVEEIVREGLAVIPQNTKFRSLIEDVLEASEAGLTWQENWRMLEDKWAGDDKCPEGMGAALNIDAKLNSGYVAIGLLYGGGDLAETIVISTRCGQDSDCNPSSAASILGNYLGASRLEEQYTKDLDWDGRKFSNTDYTFRDVAELSLRQTREVLEGSGAFSEDGTWRIPRDSEAEEVPWEQWEDGLSASFEITGGPDLSATVRLELYEHGEEIDRFHIDMGDGFSLDTVPLTYTYEQPGTYTVTCEIRGKNGTELTLKNDVTVERTALIPGHAVCTVTVPTGGGNPNPEIMRDGVIPPVGCDDSAQQYDTYDGGRKRNTVYAGIEFEETLTVTGVRFTEGKHFWDGGWFDGEPYIEVKREGEWVSAEASIDRAYPGNTEAEQGPSFEIYAFAFSAPIRCEGVRIAGKPGGQAYFISVGEIVPVVEEDMAAYSEPQERSILICSVANPLGGGSKDIRVIADGNIPDAKTAADSQQYDTYHGQRAGEEVYVGCLWHEEREITEVIFTEGNHFWDGGWFKDGDVRVELWDGKAWQAAAAASLPAYPRGNDRAVFGDGYETYVFRLSQPMRCCGFRLIGTAGGEHGFISVSELDAR
ncbi:MAG: ADP-ribosylglycohydrolase family protein [Oscillospiraceae bacterium]|nr:ADP-ribosylglycohydrolase family protein [Oscillospiraceae bacterium]